MNLSAHDRAACFWLCSRSGGLHCRGDAKKIKAIYFDTSASSGRVKLILVDFVMGIWTWLPTSALGNVDFAFWMCVYPRVVYNCLETVNLSMSLCQLSDCLVMCYEWNLPLTQCQLGLALAILFAEAQEPMEVARSRLTVAEREQCMRGCLCLYCGQAVNFIHECSSRPKDRAY